MEMNIYLVVILAAMIGEYAVRTLARVLNRGALNPKLPQAFVDYYDADSYAKSQAYARANMNLAFISSSISLIARSLLFFGVGLCLWMIGPGRLGCQKLRRAFCSSGFWGGQRHSGHTAGSLPDVVIEERFGFNKMTLGTYFGDKVKGYVIGGLLGAAVLGGILFFF